MPAEHTAHRYTRLLSTNEHHIGLYGCVWERCGSTEVRRVGTASPFAERRARAIARKQDSKGARA